MKQITDDQFIQAINDAVLRRGEGTIAKGKYWNHTINAPHCIVGEALWGIDQSMCPKDNSMLAFELLTKHGCSEAVAEAGAFAQSLNDRGLSWGLVQEGFHDALRMLKAGHSVYVVDYTVGSRLMRKHALSRAKVPANLLAGGSVSMTFNSVPKETFDILTNPEPIFPTVDCTKGGSSFKKALVEIVPAKKDHDLVA